MKWTKTPGPLGPLELEPAGNLVADVTDLWCCYDDAGRLVDTDERRTGKRAIALEPR